MFLFYEIHTEECRGESMMSAKSKKGSPEKEKVYAAEREREGGRDC